METRSYTKFQKHFYLAITLTTRILKNNASVVRFNAVSMT